MGIVASHLTRKLRRFNVLDRTERILNKEKPIPAPLHKIDADRIKYLSENDPQVKEELINKNSKLEKNLESVYVTSKGDLPDTYSKSKVKLPRNREQVFNYGFYVTEPEYVPAGRYTLTQIIECIADHYKDKQLYTAEVLANRVKIDVKLMENILKYHRIFDMYIPQKMMENKKMIDQTLISSSIDKIRKTLEVDKYSNKRKQIGEN